MPPFHRPILLSDRVAVSVRGDDAEKFLQNMMTQDVRKLQNVNLIYSCFLTPQGQILADFFVTRHADGFLLDVDQSNVDAFLKRISIFKLRQKVEMQMSDVHVYAANDQGDADPRHHDMGRRLYTAGKIDSFDDIHLYHDHAIDCGILSRASGIQFARDVMADVNFDLLGAAAWDKGCFIGQEVAARMYNRGLAKKRIVALTAAAPVLSGQVVVNQDKQNVGEVRQVHSTGLKCLAMLKIAPKNDILETTEGVRLIVT